MKDEYRDLMLAYTVDQFSARRLFQVTNTSAINSKGAIPVTLADKAERNLPFEPWQGRTQFCLF
jgi:hypothetical protein